MTLFKREGKLIAATPSLYIAPFVFYLIMMTLMPTFMNLKGNDLKQLIAVLIWFALGISFLSLLPHIYRDDKTSGILDQIRVTKKDMSGYLTAKCTALWLSVFLPMILILPLLSILYQFSTDELLRLMLAVAAGGLIMTSLGMVIMIVAFGLESQQAIISILYLPLLVPVIVLGAMTLDPLAYQASIKLLVGSALLSIVMVVPSANYLLRVMLYE